MGVAMQIHRVNQPWGSQAGVECDGQNTPQPALAEPQLSPRTRVSPWGAGRGWGGIRVRTDSLPSTVPGKEGPESQAALVGPCRSYP